MCVSVLQYCRYEDLENDCCGQNPKLETAGDVVFLLLLIFISLTLVIFFLKETYNECNI